MFKGYREESKKNWGQDTEGALDRDQIQLGAVLRIADAVEKMALRYDELIRDRDYYKNRTQSLERETTKLSHSNRGLRAFITRLKRKHNEH